MSLPMFQMVKSFYTPEECKELVGLFGSQGTKVPEYHTGMGKNVNVKMLGYDEHPLLQKFIDATISTNKLALGFNLFDTKDISKLVNFNEYNVGQEYPWHLDKTPQEHPNCDIKLTALANISTTPYLGGDFEVFIGADSQKANAFFKQHYTAGTLVILNSQVVHRVTPVTTGVRHSLSYWFMGERWR